MIKRLTCVIVLKQNSYTRVFIDVPDDVSPEIFIRILADVIIETSSGVSVGVIVDVVASNIDVEVLTDMNATVLLVAMTAL